MWKSWALLLLLSTLSWTNSFGQANSTNYLQFNLVSSITGTLNTESLLENPQTLVNAFYLKVRTERKDCYVYASIPSGITTTAPTSMASSNVILDYRSTTCPSAQQGSINQSDIPMSATNSLLFWQKRKNGTIANWYYDVKIPALGYTYAPGDYNFTIQFTMTQP